MRIKLTINGTLLTGHLNETKEVGVFFVSSLAQHKVKSMKALSENRSHYQWLASLVC